MFFLAESEKRARWKFSWISRQKYRLETSTWRSRRLSTVSLIKTACQPLAMMHEDLIVTEMRSAKKGNFDMLSATRERWACSWLNIIKKEKENLREVRAERMEEENNPPQHRHRRAMKNVCFWFDQASDGAGAAARCNDKRVNKIIAHGKITVSRLCKSLEIAFDTRRLLIHRTE